MNLHTQRIFRSGNKLVMHVNATLPDRCVKTNRPAHGQRLKRDLAWHHPALYLLILFGIIYPIVALCIQKVVTVEIGVSDDVMKKRKTAIAAGWILCLGGTALILLGISHVSMGVFIIVGVIAFIAGLIWVAVDANVVTPARIENDYVWLNGVNEAYIAELPDWSSR